MDGLTFHGKTLEAALFVVERFGTPEMREFYKDNIGFNRWLEQCETIINAERLNY